MVLRVMAADGDFLLRYRAVSNKLKKRFLRKPNVAEASEQFGQLAKELKQQDCLQYAGFCNLAMARCEQTLFNAPGEAMALTEAARLFLQAEQDIHCLQCPSFEEHLQASINCFSFAIKSDGQWSPAFFDSSLSGPRIISGVLFLCLEDLVTKYALTVMEWTPFQYCPQCLSKFPWTDYHQVYSLCLPP